MEFCPPRVETRPSSDQSVIHSKGSFIPSRGGVVKNISNDDTDTRWLQTFEQSFISHEMFYCDPSSDPRGDGCPLEPEHSFDRAQRPPSPLCWSHGIAVTRPGNVLFSCAGDICCKPGNGYWFQTALQIKRSPTFGNGYGAHELLQVVRELHERRTAFIFPHLNKPPYVLPLRSDFCTPHIQTRVSFFLFPFEFVVSSFWILINRDIC